MLATNSFEYNFREIVMESHEAAKRHGCMRIPLLSGKTHNHVT